MKVSSLIEDARRYVVGYYDDDDEQYVHWLEEDWLSYVKMAIGIVALADQSSFTKTMDIDLVEGSIQEIPEECKTLKSVRGVKDERGVITHKVRKRASNSLKLPTLSRPLCKSITNSNSDYIVKSYSLDEDDDRIIIVDPPVPQGVSGILTISCYSPPTIETEDDDIDLSQAQQTAVFELILYYAWGVDIEDTANRERSNTHWAHAMTLLQILTDADSKALKKQARLMNGNS